MNLVQIAIDCYSNVLGYALPYICTIMLIHLTVRLVMRAIWDGEIL